MLDKNIKQVLSISLATSMLLLTGCVLDDDNSIICENGSASDTSYKNFKSGLITPETLTSYIDNWETNKPANVTGRLVIVQAGPASGNKFIKSNGTDILTYQIPAGGACDPSYMRHDGVANIPGALLSGDRMDGMINAFHLDPEKDFVVFAVGKGSTSMRDVVRSIWSMNYWGWSHDRMSILNGSVDYDFSASSGLRDYLVDAPTTPPATPSNYSVKTLHTDRTDRHIYIDEMMKIAALDDKSGYFIADARGTKEYDGTKKSKTADKNCGPNHDKQCYSPYQGHIRDAVDFPYTELLQMDDQSEDVNGDGTIDKKDASFKFKSPVDLQTLFAEKGYKKGDRVVTYCRTGRKATLLTYVSDFVLGYDTTMYDGSWIQWGEMANRTDVTGSTILPAGDKWITDDPKYSVNLGYTEPEYTQSIAPYDFNSSATSSNNVRLEDQAYIK
jgi:3-mercaptopyruvate sulfurtransferase SseA